MHTSYNFPCYFAHKSVQTPQNSLNMSQCKSNHCTHWIWNSGALNYICRAYRHSFRCKCTFLQRHFSSFRRTHFRQSRFGLFFFLFCNARVYASVIIVSFVKRAFFSHFAHCNRQRKKEIRWLICAKPVTNTKKLQLYCLQWLCALCH